MVCLMLIGEALRVIISRYSGLFRRLDILQVLVIDVYLGGLILYILAIIPLGLFSTTTAWALTITFSMFSLLFHRKKFEGVKRLVQPGRKHARMKAVRDYLLARRGALLENIAVLTMFLVALWIQIIPIANFVFGSIHDTSIHALYVELILENGQIPATHQPYLPAAIIYPQGAHVVFAYSCYILGLIPPKAVFYASPLFNAMTVLAAYYLGKKIHPTRNLGLIFAFVMAFVSMWPKFVTWGSNPFIMGFPLFLVCLSFLPSLPVLLDENKLREIFVIGILLGYLASIHLAFYEVIIASAMLWLLIEASRKPKKIYKIGNFLIMCIFSILLMAPFLYRFVKYYPYPGHNIGLPSDIVVDVKSPPDPRGTPSHPPLISILMNFPMWLFSCYNIHPYPDLRVLWIGLVSASVLTLFFSLRKKRALYVAERIALIAFGAGLLLDVCAYIFPLIPWGRISLVIYVSACLLIAVFTVRLYFTLRIFFPRIFCIIKRNKKKVFVTRFMASLLVVSALFVPFVYYTISYDPQELQTVYNIFAVTTESDYEIMMWMKHNLYDNAIILISPYESGGFIPSVSQKKAIFPLSAYWFSHSYRRIIDLIHQRVINETTYELMNNFEITHIFVGSRAIQQWGKLRLEENPRWDPMLFLGNPNFKLVKNIGGSYLFNVSYRNANIVFQEDFEYLSLTQMGWRFAEMEDGNYNLTIVHDESDNHLLRVVAERGESSRWLYSCWLNRKIYLWSLLNVNLSFHLNASSVKAPNTVSISIFDADRQRHITFATPSVLYNNQTCVIELNSTCVDFSYDISKIWENTYDELLPNITIVELAAVNVDNSSPTDVFFDNITITINQ